MQAFTNRNHCAHGNQRPAPPAKRAVADPGEYEGGNDEDGGGGKGHCGLQYEPAGLRDLTRLEITYRD